MTGEDKIQSTHRDDRAGEELSNDAALFGGVDRLAEKQSDAGGEQADGSERIHRDHARGEIFQQVDLSNPSRQNGKSDRGRKTTGG